MSTTPIAETPTASARRLAIPAWLVPGLGDLLLIGLVFWLFCASPQSWDHFMGDANTGLHIRTGDYILDHWRVPTTDLYSFSRPGGRWFAFEWLSCVVYAALHRVAGLAGVAMISAIVLLLWPVVQLRDCIRRGADPVISVMLIFAAVRAAGIHFLARPHLFSMLFTAVLVSFVACERERPTRRVWTLVPFAAVWANFHGGFLVLPAYTGLLAAGLFAERRFAQARRWLAVFAACCAATLVNPYGFELHRHIAHFLGSSWLAHMVQEYAPATTFWGDGHTEVFFALLILGGFCALLMLRRRRFVEPLWIAFFGYMAVHSARHITIFVIVAVPMFALELTRWFHLVVERMGRTSFAGVLATVTRDAGPSLARVTPWGAIAAFALLVPGAPSQWPQSFPSQIVQRDADVLTGSRLFTTDHWGDYLIYRLWPRQRVFVDGRSDFYGEQIGIEYLTMLETDPGWQKLFDAWGFTAALLPMQSHLARTLIIDPRWRIADHAGDAVLLIRRSGYRPLPPASQPAR